jgi:hypothetical protein
VVRHLYDAAEPITQVELGRHAGVSQPAVSQYLRSLRANGDASFENPGWLPNRATLPRAYLEHYSSRFTDQSCWSRIDSVSAQTDDILAMRGDVIASGDVAADLVRPWRVPTVAIIYGRLGDDAMDGLGFVPADTAATASVLIRPIPDDRFTVDSEDLGKLRVAARVHLIADVIGLGGDDRSEAAGRLAETRDSSAR